MEITTREFARADVISVSGQLDAATTPDLEKSIQGFYDNKRYRIVLDLSGVDFLASAAMRALVESLKTAKKHRGDLVLAEPSPRIRRALEIVGLSTVFSTYDDITEAVGQF